MRRVPDQPPSSASRVVIIGNFDGVHTGHRGVIAEAGRHGHVVAVTFCPHPLRVLRPAVAPRLISSAAQRRELLLAAGVSEVVEVEFTPEVSQWSPAEFVDQVLMPLEPSRIVVGQNFRFGHRAAGDPPLLAELGRGRFEVEELPLRQGVSSSLIREALTRGDIETANGALGRPFCYRETVVIGHQRGRELGFPTANLPVGPERIAPADGIYAGWLSRIDTPGERLPAAISVGTNPTFDDVSATVVEAHALDRTDLELYGVEVAVEFEARLRGNDKFDGIEALMVQIGKDCDAARATLSRLGAP